jgi:hypothetical protein
MEMSDQLENPAAFPGERNLFPVEQEAGRSQSQSRHFRKGQSLSLLLGIELWIIQPVV